MLKLAYNANGLRNMDVISAIDAVAEYKYSGIEIALNKAHLNPNTVTDSDLKNIKKEIEEKKITACCLATGASNLLSDEEYEPSLITSDKDSRSRRIVCIKGSIDIANKLSIPIVNISSGLKKQDVSDEEARVLLVSGIKECLAYSEDIILALEPEPKMFVETTEQAIEIIKLVNSDRLKLNMDIGHVVCCEENYLEKIHNAVKYTAHIHIEDIKDRVHYHLIPGEGDVDLGKVIQILYDDKYEGYISVELYHHADVYKEALQKSYDYLSKIVDKLK